MKKIFRSAAICVFLLSGISLAWAQNAEFPERILSDAEELLLNGSGIRKATIFSIKVYTAALYVKQKSQNDRDIIESESPKQLQMIFLREIEEKKIIETWRKSLINNNSDADLWFSALLRLTKGIGDLRKGSKLVLSFSAKGARLESSHGFSREVSDPAFARALIRIWLGANPSDEELKQGLLGISG